MEPVHDIEEIEDEEYGHRLNPRKKSSKEIVIPVIEDDIDLDTVREYISQMKENNNFEKVSSNKATNGSKLADFEAEGIEEREQKEILPVHLYETKEKMLEEYKRRLEISETKYKLSKEVVDANDPEKGLLYATEASSILYEQFVTSCRKLEEEHYKAILGQKTKCMLMIAMIHYKQKNYKETIRELNALLKDYNDVEDKAYYLRGKARKKVKKVKRAVEDIKKACDLSPENASYLNKLEKYAKESSQETSGLISLVPLEEDKPSL